MDVAVRLRGVCHEVAGLQLLDEPVQLAGTRRHGAWFLVWVGLREALLEHLTIGRQLRKVSHLAPADGYHVFLKEECICVAGTPTVDSPRDRLSLRLTPLRSHHDA